MTKRIWLSVLDREKDKDSAKKLKNVAIQYGLTLEGHFFESTPDSLAWTGVVEQLCEQNTPVWAVLGSVQDFMNQDIRYMLSLIALGVQATKGHSYPILLLVHSGEITSETLPTPLRGAQLIAPDAPTLGAKIVAQANVPLAKSAQEYRLCVHGLPGLGLWLELGPGQGQSWQGALLGVEEAEITAQGVGPAGTLPEKAVLEYPMQGLKLAMGERSYIAWAVKNKLGPEDSYFAGVRGNPSSILFGPAQEDDSAEFFVVRMT